LGFKNIINWSKFDNPIMANSKTVNCRDFIFHIENMLKVPEMYAQNAGSLEDQLQVLYEYAIGSMENRARYHRFCRSKNGGTVHSLASVYKEIKDIMPVLREFYDPEIAKMKLEIE